MRIVRPPVSREASAVCLLRSFVPQRAAAAAAAAAGPVSPKGSISAHTALPAVGWCALGRALRLQPLPASPPVAPTDRTARCRTLSQPLRLLSNRGRAVQRCAARCSPQSCLSRGVVLRAAASHPSPGRDRPLPLFERQCPCHGAPPLFSCQHPCALHCAAEQRHSAGAASCPAAAPPPPPAPRAAITCLQHPAAVLTVAVSSARPHYWGLSICRCHQRDHLRWHRLGRKTSSAPDGRGTIR